MSLSNRPALDNKPDEQLAKKFPSTHYIERLKKYLEESKDLSSLEKHVFLFLDEKKTFSPATVTAELDKMHGQNTWFKGNAIALFNATHSSGNVMCPAFQAKFAAE